MSSNFIECPNCKNLVNSSSKFCSHCGTKLSFEQPTMNPSPQNLGTGINNTQQQGMRINNTQQTFTPGIKTVTPSMENEFDIIETYNYNILNNGIEANNAYFSLKNNQFEDALRYIDKAIEINSNDPYIWSLKSLILFKLNYVEDAISSVDIALNLDDMCEMAWACKTTILENINDMAALYCCNEFLLINPNNPNMISKKTSLSNKISFSNPQPQAINPTQGINTPQQPQGQNPGPNIGISTPQQQTINPTQPGIGISTPQQPGTNIDPWGSGSPTSGGQINIWDLKVDVNDQFNFEGEHTYKYTSFNEIFSPENRDKLKNNIMTQGQYNNILFRIKETSYNNFNQIVQNLNIDLNTLSPLEKVLLFTKSFVEVDTKASGADLGNYACNKINLDDRLYTANQITTLIHELSHHLLAEIFEQSLMIIWDTDKTDEIESFVWYSLMFNNANILFNEYCAHTVQGRFTPHGYQDYGSFENILKRFEGMDSESYVQLMAVSAWVGNSFSQDILTIIESFIDYNLREEIKNQFKTDYPFPPNYAGISLEITQNFDKEFFLKQINEFLIQGFDSVISDRDAFFDIKRRFELNRLNNQVGGI